MRSDYVSKADLKQYRELYEKAKRTHNPKDQEICDNWFMFMMASYGHQPDKVDDFDLRTGRIICGLGDGRNKIRGERLEDKII